MKVHAALTQPLAFPLRLRRFLTGGTSLAGVRDDLRQALESRDARFLTLVQRQIYARRESPYLRLLEHAGCAFPDLQDLVGRHGLEGALGRLAAAGVYLSAAEAKGREPVVRGRLAFRVDPRALELARAGVASASTGTSSRPQHATSSFDWLARQTAVLGAFVLAHGLESHRQAVFEPILPGVAGILYMVMLARLGIPCERWFARAIPFRNVLERAYFSVMAHELAAVGTRWGPGFGRPETIGAEGLDVIARWVADRHAHGLRTSIRTVASSAARIAVAAADRGLSLEGATFVSSGEPLTDAKRQAIERVGGRTTVLYGFEPGTVIVGWGCANPVHGDEMHLSRTTLALIESPHPHPVPGGQGAVRPLLFTTLYESAGRLLLNVASGDYATLDERDCGCGMHALGLTVHLHHVRSYEKFTSEGLSYPIDDVVTILESRLPAEFGGGPCDYQLIEEEGSGGRTCLTLRIDPRVGDLDEARVLGRLAQELGAADRNRWFMTEVWRADGTFRVERRVPHTSARGKTLPIHLRVGQGDGR